MAEDGEPRENIGGEFGTAVDAANDRECAQSRTEAVVDRLGELYWRKRYGDRDAFECLVRTILSQNTSDVASQPAFEALIESCGEGDLATTIAEMEHGEIASRIRSAGLYNKKATVLKEIAAWVASEFGGTAGFDAFVTDDPYHHVRKTLLSLSGIGPKTADCVLLFAGGREGVFPVDTHVHRIYRRLGIAPPDADHETVRAILEGRTNGSDGVPPAKCGFGHTASIQFGREYCTARTPACLDGPEACPLVDLCEQVGVDTVAGTITDPAAMR